MVNKIYVIIKKYIKENYKSLIFLILFAVFCFYPSGYSIYKPGGTINASARISGNELYTSKGTFNMAYVSMIEGNLPFFLLAKVIPNWDLVKNEDMTYSDTETINDSMVRDHLYYKEAISNATLVALKKSKKEFEITKIHYYLIFRSKKCQNDLKVGDEILSYDNIPFTDLEEFIKYINTKKENQKIKIKYIRDKKEYTSSSTIYKEDNALYLGMSIVKIYDIKTKYNIKIDSKSSESGPSGGLITSLAIYDSLVKEDITKGYKIVGTGSIDSAGNIGEIGSVSYKISSAVKDKADIFLCPKENYDEAIKYAKKKKYDIIIKRVSTFDEALDILNNLKEK